MNSLRIRAGRLDPRNCKDHADYPFAVLVSQDGLIWWPVNRYKTFDEALSGAKAFEVFVKENQLVKLATVNWSTKL